MENFREYLIQEEKSELTVETYAVVSVNSMISAINTYLLFIGRPDCRVKTIKQQRRVFIPEEKELTKGEYGRLLKAAERKPRLYLLMQTICSTGIRVSEHRFITVEAAKTGYAEVRMKGKHRTVFLEKKLCKALLRYAKENHITGGSIFITATGKPMDRCNIWAEMKKLCSTAGVRREKVFPHNLRHLFARLYYSIEHDIVRLADILGHSNINTTRIYTMESGQTHRKQMERLQILLTT
ncbi:MAG: tyrosine-type recombinase/integrase [Oscillospiraceae bacterium]|nr:tyrosine-type recombinase/integrase [Oscillospiraceae bacterium]